MKCDVILAGVGGQGVLSVGFVIASSALEEGLHVKQSEVHGMAQRGGAVVAHLRISDSPVHSDLIPQGAVDTIVGMEPMESLRYASMLSPSGVVVTSSDPVVNIPNYPDLQRVLADLRALGRSHLVPAEDLARRAGSRLATNMVMVGAASSLVPIGLRVIERQIRKAFARKGDDVVQANLRAFHAGREAIARAAA